MTGVDHTSKLELMRSVGYDHVIDYTRENFTENGERYDFILDVKTTRSVFSYLQSLKKGGIYATVGGDTSKLLQIVALGPVISMVKKRKVALVMLKQNKDLGYYNDLFTSGKMKPLIDGPYRFEQTPDVFKRYGDGKQKLTNAFRWKKQQTPTDMLSAKGRGVGWCSSRTIWINSSGFVY